MRMSVTRGVQPLCKCLVAQLGSPFHQFGIIQLNVDTLYRVIRSVSTGRGMILYLRIVAWISMSWVAALSGRTFITLSSTVPSQMMW